MKRIVVCLALLLAFAAPLSAASTAATAAAAPAPAGRNVVEPLAVGIAVATTSDVALFGEEQVHGAQVAEAYFNAQGGVNGTPIRLVLQDTGGGEAGAVAAFKSLIDAGVLGIVGPTLSQQAFAADPLAERAKVPVVAPSNTAKGIPQIGAFISRVSAPMSIVAPKSLQKALELRPGIKKAAVFYAQNDAFSVSESAVFQKALKQMGIAVVSLQKFNTTDADFSSKEVAVLQSGAELVVISGLATDSGALVKHLRQRGYTGLIVGGNGLNSPNMFPVCGELCDGVLVAQAYSPQADSPVNAAFVKQFSELYKKTPAQFSAQAFASVQVIVEALRKVEKDAGRKLRDMKLAEARVALNKALTSGMGFSTPLGEIRLDREGEVDQKQFYVSIIVMNPDKKSGTFQLLK